MRHSICNRLLSYTFLIRDFEFQTVKPTCSAVIVMTADSNSNDPYSYMGPAHITKNGAVNLFKLLI